MLVWPRDSWPNGCRCPYTTCSQARGCIIATFHKSSLSEKTSLPLWGDRPGEVQGRWRGDYAWHPAVFSVERPRNRSNRQDRFLRLCLIARFAEHIHACFRISSRAHLPHSVYWPSLALKRTTPASLVVPLAAAPLTVARAHRRRTVLVRRRVSLARSWRAVNQTPTNNNEWIWRRGARRFPHHVVKHLFPTSLSCPLSQ